MPGAQLGSGPQMCPAERKSSPAPPMRIRARPRTRLCFPTKLSPCAGERLQKVFLLRLELFLPDLVARVPLLKNIQGRLAARAGGASRPPLLDEPLHHQDDAGDDEHPEDKHEDHPKDAKTPAAPRSAEHP